MKTEFEIVEEYKNNFNQISIVNRSSGEQITVLPALGARLNECVLNAKGKNFSVLNRLESDKLKSPDQLFNNAKLFPFAGRVKNGIYEFNGEQYNLPLNYAEEQNASHGLVYDKPFRLADYNLEKEEASISFEYMNSQSLQGYPFGFGLFVQYTLLESSEVRCITRVTNKSESTLPFSDGWHYYFCPGDSIEQVSIKTDAADLIELDQYGIPTGNECAAEESDYAKINDRVYDNLFRVNEREKVITSLYSPAEDITLSVWQQGGKDGYKYLIIYTPSDRKSIAIEPVTSNINSLNTKHDLICLEPGMSWQSECGFFLR